MASRMERSRSFLPSNGSVKIGGLWKRSQGLSRFTKPNYRHRVFILTEHTLSYYSGTVDRVGQLKGRVSLNAITAMEFVDDSAFGLSHTFQIVYHSKKHGFVTLYITATDSTECSDWVSTLRQACYFNQDMMMHFHPGALFRNRWSCCKQQSRNSLGCQPTYHLLTQSSSRYAEMRRKDTLTSSQGSWRQSKSNSLQRAADRGSVSHETHMDASVETTSSSRGLSNSCVDLVHRNVQNKFGPLSPDATSAASYSSSLLSNAPSISVGSITLTHLSLPESSGFSSPPARLKPAKARDAEQVGTTHAARLEPKKRSSRSQVAPEDSSKMPPSQFPSSGSHPELREEQRGSTAPGVPRRYTHSHSVQFSRILQQPPGYSPSLVRSRYHCLTEPRRVLHSKTFLDAVSPSVRQNNLSLSLSVLPPKPVLEPKISVTDPNVIHV